MTTFTESVVESAGLASLEGARWWPCGFRSADP
jgi:hypothetical protein